MEIKEVLDELRKQKKDGNIVFLTWDGFKASPLEDFITQPADGILYDLNRLEEVTTTLAEADKIDKRWVNDYAVATIIRFLYKEMSALKAERDRLRELLRWLDATGLIDLEVLAVKYDVAKKALESEE